MQARLTRKLMAIVLGGALSAALPAVSSADQSKALQGDEQVVYLDGLKRLYLTGNERQALLAHSNALLETYALRAGYQVGQAQPEDLLYRFSVADSGELILREERRGRRAAPSPCTISGSRCSVSIRSSAMSVRPAVSVACCSTRLTAARC